MQSLKQLEINQVNKPIIETQQNHVKITSFKKEEDLLEAQQPRPNPVGEGQKDAALSGREEQPPLQIQPQQEFPLVPIGVIEEAKQAYEAPVELPPVYQFHPDIAMLCVDSNQQVVMRFGSLKLDNHPKMVRDYSLDLKGAITKYDAMIAKQFQYQIIIFGEKLKEGDWATFLDYVTKKELELGLPKR